MKRILACLLAAVITIGAFPLQVSAFTLRPAHGTPVTRFLGREAEIRSLDTSPAATGNRYNIEFIWTQPPAAMPNDMQWQIPNHHLGTGQPLPQELIDAHGGVEWNIRPGSGLWTRYPSRYDITFFNRTTGVHYPTVSIERDELLALAGSRAANGEVPGGTRLLFSLNVELSPSSLYEIDIRPFHQIPVYTQLPPLTPGGEPRDGWNFVPAEVNPQQAHPDAEHRGMVFMTDINVINAFVTDDAIVIDWENPLWGSQSFPFWEFTVHNALTGAPLSALPQNQRIVSTENLTVLSAQGGRQILRHTLSHPGMQIGHSYFVRIEPMRNQADGNRVRQSGAAGNSIILENTSFSFAARPQNFHHYQSPSRIMTPTLNVVEDGDGSLRLHWSNLAANSADRVIIEWWDDPFPTIDPPPIDQYPTPSGGIIAELSGAHATRQNWWPVGQINPIRPLAFTLRIYRRSENPEVEYDFLGRSNMAFYNPDDADFTPYTPTLQPIRAVTDDNDRFLYLSLAWRAFARAPRSDAEKRDASDPNLYHFPFEAQLEGRNYIDMDIQYRVFISDSWSSINWPSGAQAPFAATVFPEIIPNPGMIKPDELLPHYEWFNLTHYTWVNPSGTVTELRPMTANNVYFVRIEAVRPHPGGNAFEPSVSAPSFGVIYIPPEDDLHLIPEMVEAPPLRGKATNLPDEDPAITLDWDLRYVEIGNPDPVRGWDRWYASAGIRESNDELLFGSAARLIPGVRNWASLNTMIQSDSVLWSQMLDRTPAGQNRFRDPSSLSVFANEARDAILDYLGIGDFPNGPLPLRVQDAFHMHYRIHVVEHADVLAFGASLGKTTLEGAFEAYRDEWLLLEENTDMWEHIGRPTPNPLLGTSSYTFTEFQGTALKPNTAYVVFFQPHTAPGSNPTLLSLYPTYVIVTVPDEFIPSIPTPTTPVLFPGDPATDSAVSVRWGVQGDENPDPRTLIRYELRWSESILAHPDNPGFVHLTWDDIQALWQSSANPDGQKRLVNVGGNPFHHFTIEDLFPDTAHYIWIRAFNADNIYSGWSNPIEIQTRDISAPMPPGLGLVSGAHLNAFNLTNNTEYEPIESNAINFLLTRTISDYRTHALPRASGGQSTGGSVEVLNIANMRERDYAIRFADLIHNRHYYARARTVMTVTRGAARSYSYEIQLADNSDFLDAVTFTLPALVAFNPLTMRRAESPWVNMELSTSPGADDFDGAFRPEQFPLPEYDWEITYANGALQWRFRTNRIGADGRPDQQADQRFISRLIDSRVHRYTVDLSEYARRTEWPVNNRELIIPWTILRAFDERRITLEIDFGDTMVSIPPGAFDTAAVRALNMGVGSEIRIAMQTNENAAGLPALPQNNRYMSLPQRLSVTAVTHQRTLTLNNFARAIGVTAQTDHVAGPDGTVRTGLFFTSPQTANWQDTAGMRTETLRPGTFAAVSREAPRTAFPNDTSLPAMQRVTARLTFTDMHEYNPRMAVSSAAFNNIVNALANNQGNVMMGANLSAADRQSLERARMLAPSALTYEQAVDILVRFYELRTRRAIVPMTAPQMVIGINDAAPALQQSILKAADIGFVTGAINPRGSFTMGDLMVMLDIIITDTGF